jgi:uncharacterized protein (TIGR02246 family)
MMLLIPHEIEGDADATAAFLALAATPAAAASPAATVERLMVERTVRDHIYSYADAFDSKDLARIVSHFSPDAYLTTPRGGFRGREAIRAFYEPFTTMNRFSYHRIQAVTVRGSGDEAAVVASFHAPFIGEGDDARSQYGRYLGILRREGDGWLLADWRILVDHTRAFPRSLGR